MKYRPTRTLNKVKAGSAGSGAGVALAQIAVFFLRQGYPDLPGEVELAINVFIPVALAWVAAWLTPLAAGEIEPALPSEADRRRLGM